MSLGDNIKKYRKELGITQEGLANTLCVTNQAVSKWESGVGLPDITQVIPLAQALNVSTDALFGFNSESFDTKLAEEVKKKADELKEFLLCWPFGERWQAVEADYQSGGKQSDAGNSLCR